jgi:hypothetical protein
MSAIRTDAPQNTFVEPPSMAIREGSFTSDEIKDEIQNDIVKSRLESFVQNNMEGQGGSYITKLFKFKNTYLASTTSKYCENLKREHGSNHVWFIISGQYIAQKCFCRCETIRARRDGFCKDFCGRKHKLSPLILNELYPEKQEIQKCPDLKKRVEKPQFNKRDAKPRVQAFIQKFMVGQESTTVVDISKNKTNYIALTTSTYCESIKGNHEDCVMSYMIKGNKITQACPKCKGKKNVARTYTLVDSDLVKLLKQ